MPDDEAKEMWEASFGFNDEVHNFDGICKSQSLLPVFKYICPHTEAAPLPARCPLS
jgi:hypothetical protein